MTGDAISRESNGLGEDGFTLEEIYDAMQDGADDDCYECGGDGWIVDDCFEDTCCCLNPETQHGVIPCPNCNPGGSQA